MIKLEDLTGIPEDKRKETVGCLEDLITLKMQVVKFLQLSQVIISTLD